MHPKFRQYTEGREPEESLRLRVSSEEKAILNDTLKVEGGSITELLVEGVWRVVDSRRDLLDQAAPVARLKQPKGETLNIRLSNTEAAMLGKIATEEGRSLGDLVSEGIWHVLASRRQNMDYQAKARQILALLNEVEATRAALHERGR